MKTIDVHVITGAEVAEQYGVTEKSSVEERVAAGARWLDDNVPGWEERVSLPEFDIENRCDCVLGQIFATVDADSASRNAAMDLGFDRVVEGFDSSLLDPSMLDNQILSRTASRALAFDALGDDVTRDAYDSLQREWEVVIGERQGVEA